MFLRLAMLSTWLPLPQSTALHPPQQLTQDFIHFSFSQIQIDDVLKELQNLNPYKSAGLDNLDHLFLKLSTAMVATSITSLFNLSFVSSEIPKDWKVAVVIPLFKGEDTLDPNCYRPTYVCFLDLAVWHAVIFFYMWQCRLEMTTSSKDVGKYKNVL